MGILPSRKKLLMVFQNRKANSCSQCEILQFSCKYFLDQRSTENVWNRLVKDNWTTAKTFQKFEEFFSKPQFYKKKNAAHIYIISLYMY